MSKISNARVPLLTWTEKQDTLSLAPPSVSSTWSAFSPSKLAPEERTYFHHGHRSYSRYGDDDEDDDDVLDFDEKPSKHHHRSRYDDDGGYEEGYRQAMKDQRRRSRRRPPPPMDGDDDDMDDPYGSEDDDTRGRSRSKKKSSKWGPIIVGILVLIVIILAIFVGLKYSGTSVSIDPADASGTSDLLGIGTGSDSRPTPAPTNTAPTGAASSSQKSSTSSINTSSGNTNSTTAPTSDKSEGTTKPTEGTNKPKESTDKPKESSEKPAETTEKLAETTERSAEAKPTKTEEEKPEETQEQPAGGGGGCEELDTATCADQDTAVKVHNQARAKHHAEPLVWNQTLAIAEGKYVTDNCNFEHSKDIVSGGYGENLAAISGNDMGDAKNMIDMWYDEVKAYNYETGETTDPNVMIGHFTQVVWTDTKSLGCAKIHCPVVKNAFSPGTLYACAYYPPGNWVGMYKEKVLPP